MSSKTCFATVLLLVTLQICIAEPDRQVLQAFGQRNPDCGRQIGLWTIGSLHTTCRGPNRLTNINPANITEAQCCESWGEFACMKQGALQIESCKPHHAELERIFFKPAYDDVLKQSCDPHKFSCKFEIPLQPGDPTVAPRNYTFAELHPECAADLQRDTFQAELNSKCDRQKVKDLGEFTPANITKAPCCTFWDFVDCQERYFRNLPSCKSATEHLDPLIDSTNVDYDKQVCDPIKFGCRSAPTTPKSAAEQVNLKSVTFTALIALFVATFRQFL